MDTPNINQSGTQAEGEMRNFACKDAGMNCDWTTTGRSDDEVLSNVQRHAQDSHKDVNFTDETKNKVRSLIKPHQKAA